MGLMKWMIIMRDGGLGFCAFYFYFFKDLDTVAFLTCRKRIFSSGALHCLA
jgi:hypothetical protein